MRRHYLLAVLLVVLILHHVDRNVLLVLLEPIRREFGLSDMQLGALSGIAYALPFALAGIPLGALADRLNRSRLLSTLLAVWSVFTAFAGWSRSYAALLVARAAVGAAESGAPPTMLSLIADAYSTRSRPAALSLLFAGPLIGLLLGSLIGGAAAAAFGWRGALWTVAAPGIAMAAVVWRTLPEPTRGRFDGPDALGGHDTRDGAQAPRHASVPTVQVLQFVLRHAAIRAVALGMSAASIVSIGIASWIPALLMRDHRLPVQTAGADTALAVGLSGGLGALVTAWIAARYGQGRPDRLLRMCAVGLLLSIPAGVAGALATSVPGTVTNLALWALASTLYIGPGHSLYLGWVPSRMRGSLGAIIIVGCNLLGTGIGPQLTGLASDLLRRSGDARSLAHALALLALLGAVPGLIFLCASFRPMPEAPQDLP